MPSPEINRIQAAAIQAVKNQATQFVRTGVGRSYLRGLQAAAKQAQEYARAFEEPSDSEREKMFQTLGENAQRSMLAAYGQLVSRRSTIPSYRSGNGRLSGGVLRRAIGSSEFFTASPDGLSFGNTSFLDAEAKHWHRINFGAGARGKGVDVSFPMGDGTISFSESPSPGFSMPPGFWLGPDGNRQTSGTRGTGAFYPSSGQSLEAALGKAGARSQRRQTPDGWKATQGIAGADFMGAGVRRIAQDLPKLIQALIEDMDERAKKSLRSESLVVRVRGVEQLRIPLTRE